MAHLQGDVVVQGKPNMVVPGAQVKVMDKGTEIGSGFCDFQGSFYVRVPKPGEYMVEIKKQGYEVFRNYVNSKERVKIELKKKPPGA